jgi:alcohol dehydrogenase
MDLMLNSWEIIGNFMYPVDAYRRLLDLVRAGLLDIDAIRPHTFPPNALPGSGHSGQPRMRCNSTVA